MLFNRYIGGYNEIFPFSQVSWAYLFQVWRRSGIFLSVSEEAIGFLYFAIGVFNLRIVFDSDVDKRVRPYEFQVSQQSD